MRVEMAQWENYGIGFNASYDDDGYICIDSDVSLYDIDDLAEFVMNTPPPPSGLYYHEMTLNGRLDFGYSGKPYIAPSECISFTTKYPKYGKSFLKYNSSYAFRKCSMKALGQYIEYIKEMDGGLIIRG